MNKIGKGGKMGPVVFVLAIAAVIGIGFWQGWFGSGTQSIAGTTGTNVLTGGSSCPDDGVTDFQFRYKDSLAAADTQYAVSGYLIPVSGSSYFEALNAGSATAGTYSTADNLVCDPSNPGVYQMTIVALQNQSHSATLGQNLKMSAALLKQDITGKKFDDLQVRMRNMDTDSYYRLNATNTTSFDEFLYTVSLTNDATVAADITTVGTDGTISIEIPIKTGSTRSQFGEDGLKTFVVIDADSSDWDEPIVRWKGQSSKADVFEQMGKEDRDYFTSYEYSYEIGSIGDATKYLEITFEAADGVNPDMDPIITFCSESRYLSGKEADTVKVGCFDDDSSKTVLASQVSTAKLNSLLLNIN